MEVIGSSDDTKDRAKLILQGLQGTLDTVTTEADLSNGIALEYFHRMKELQQACGVDGAIKNIFDTRFAHWKDSLTLLQTGEDGEIEFSFDTDLEKTCIQEMLSELG